MNENKEIKIFEITSENELKITHSDGYINEFYLPDLRFITLKKVSLPNNSNEFTTSFGFHYTNSTSSYLNISENEMDFMLIYDEIISTLGNKVLEIINPPNGVHPELAMATWIRIN